MAETRIRYGVNFIGDEDFVGMSIRDALDEVQEELNLPSNPTVLVNDDQVGMDYVIKSGDNLEVIKQSGSKG